MTDAPERIAIDTAWAKTFPAPAQWRDELEYIRADIARTEADAMVAAEREIERAACAELADEIAMMLRDNKYGDCADGAEDVAAAIRARAEKGE